MPTPFARTIRSLQADGFRGSFFWLALGALLLVAWVFWLSLARVSIYESSLQARTEVGIGVHTIQALGSGRIVKINLSLGREVEADEILVELDASSEKLLLEQEQLNLQSLIPTLEKLRAIAAGLEEKIKNGGSVTSAEVAEAKARLKAAQTEYEVEERKAKRAKTLHEQGSMSEAEYQDVLARVEEKKNAVDIARANVRIISAGGKLQKGDLQAELASLQLQILEKEGQIATKEAEITRLKNEIDKRVIRAPISGRLGAVASLRVGEVVNAGDRLGTVVPPGELKVVAEFDPQAAVGRLRPGQIARLELDGFPWTEYGRLDAVVAQVADEARDGTVKVEFHLNKDTRSAIPLQHGMPGTIEVEVERVSPAALILRTAGQLVSGAGAKTSGAAPAGGAQ